MDVGLGGGVGAGLGAERTAGVCFGACVVLEAMSGISSKLSRGGMGGPGDRTAWGVERGDREAVETADGAESYTVNRCLADNDGDGLMSFGS